MPSLFRHSFLLLTLLASFLLSCTERSGTAPEISSSTEQIDSSTDLSSVTHSSTPTSTPASSSSASLSSSIPIGTCLRTLVPNATFKFVNGDTEGGKPIIRGWEEGNVWHFFAGDWVVPEGYDCDFRVQVGAHMLNSDGVTGDLYNLYPLQTWQGGDIEETLIEKVTIYSGEQQSSFAGYSSVVRPSSSSTPVSSNPTSSAGVSSSSSTPTGHCILSWFTESTFNSYFPNRHPNYTWNAFKEALAAVPNFICSSAGSDIYRQKQEMAAVFAHWKQEVADLVYVEEICGTQGTCLNTYNTDWSNGNWPPVPGKSYHGRGAKQISWPGNYGEASEFLFGDKNVLLSNPERVKNEGKLAFATSFWFWWARGCDVAYWNTGFGATTQIINGALECGSNYGASAQARETYYRQYLSKLGVSDSRSTRTGC